ncbi:Fungal-trans domain-containing protein [Fusarium keratoplasticum]|nr:Fungal-trans domain-containing protein [Fusarium keratoplasticum]
MRGKVPSACERCRKQKLKCDIERPCTLCVRSNVECITPPVERWRVHHPQKETPTSRGEPAAKRRRLRRTRDGSSAPASQPEGEGPASPEVISSSPVQAPDDSTGDAPWNASSTITLVEEAFHHHEAPSPEEAETSAFLASTWAHPRPRVSGQRQPQGAPSPLQRMLSQHLQNTRRLQVPRSSISIATEQELLMLLPDLEVATTLVENYFNRIHWFMLVFHQRDFRNKFQNLYGPGPRPSNEASQTNGRVGYTAVLLAVFATSLQYTNAEQKDLLLSHGIDAEALKNNILVGLKLRFLDIISLGSLEVVQMCILLGSYYLYHGEPEMAWPLCGSGLRIAQALNLHRRVPNDKSDDESLRKMIEDRKRAWWAIYEIETFCSMLYGFPSSISDRDCDIAPLNPYDEYSGSMSEEQYATKPNLLFFKCAMSKLSAIVKSALDDLYGTRCNGERQGPSQAARLKSLVNKVASLNSRLLRWNDTLSPKLKYDELAGQSLTSDQVAGHSTQSEVEFEEHLFRLQALSLKLAYENARILIHRPLLSFKMRRPPSEAREDTPGYQDPFQLAMDTCRDAALQISQVGSTVYLREASETYAIAFVSLHLLTAGVTLCISISLDPLSLKAYESRMGIRRLMQIQAWLKEKSIVAAQGLDITTRLMSLVMAKEVDAMFEVGPGGQTTGKRPTDYERGDASTGISLERPSEQAPAQTPVEVSAAADGDLSELSHIDLPSETIDGTFDDQLVEFCENTFMTEAVLEYEQAITNPLSIANPNEEPVFFDNQQDTFLGGTSLGQEQGWIWGWNFLG